MYENTILNALKQYDIHIRIMNGLNDIKINSSRLNQIRNCMEYVESGNEVTTIWLQENHTVVSKAIKYAHDYIHRNYVKSDSEYLGQEHKELHFCDQFFTEFYEKLGVDNKYMDIDF